MTGSKDRAFASLVNVSLEQLVPADHFYRHLHKSLDLFFVRELVAPFYAAGGRPSVDPIVFFKLQLIMFFEGIRSERQLVRTAADRLSLRWYLGYDLHEELPDHSSLTRIRDRYGVDTFRRFFERIITIENIVAVEEQGIRAYVPLPNWENKTSYLGSNHFTYDAQRDVYICPPGQPLHRYAVEPTSTLAGRSSIEPGLRIATLARSRRSAHQATTGE